MNPKVLTPEEEREVDETLLELIAEGKVGSYFDPVSRQLAFFSTIQPFVRRADDPTRN